VTGASLPTNGWTFWKFRDWQTAKLMEIDVLRQKYQRKSRSSYRDAAERFRRR
jgi:hypothetical protein